MAYYQTYRPKENNNKYKNINQVYNGIRYDSKLEAKKAFDLTMLLRQKEILKWDRQVKIEINFKQKKNGEWVLTPEKAMDLKKKNIPFRHFRNYYMDFVVYHLDGSVEYVEIKGMETEVWKMKFFLTEMMFDAHETIYLTVEK